MERISHTCALLLLLIVASGFYQGVTAWKPKMTPAVDEMQIQEGDELRIKCQGVGKLQFSTEEITGNVVQQSPSDIVIESDLETYTFIRPNATRVDTGWYACAEEGIEIVNDEYTIDHPSEDISWIYVYVDSSEPFAVMEAFYETISVVAGHDLVIPCRPTSPNLPVILQIAEGNIPVPESTIYDPKIGFILKAVGKDRTGASLMCKLNVTVEDDETIWPFYWLHVADNQPLATPEIDQDRIRHVVWGQDLTLVCRLRVSDGASFKLEWEPPDSVPQESLVRGNVTRDKNGDHRPEIWKTELTIKNIQKSDEGIYTCVATGMSDIKTPASAKIQVWDPSYTYVNVTVIGSSAITLSEREVVQWRVEIDTYPEDFKWEWYTPNGKRINIIGTSSNGRYSHNVTGRTHMFRISNLIFENSGNYTLEVSTSVDKTTVILPLTVIGPPIVTFHENPPFYAPGENKAIIARIIGLPPPNVTWSYIEYPDFPLKGNSNFISLSDIRNGQVDGRPFSLVSRLNVTINMTGEVMCRACNIINCTEITHQIFVSDVAGAFGIRRPDIVTEGDDIEVTCGASVYNYTDIIQWTAKLSRDPESNSERIRITKEKTKFTTQAILHIDNVRKSDSGEYLCEARNMDDQLDTEAYELLVEDARAPEFVFTNMNDSEIPINLATDRNKAVMLECRADGRPIPKITWYKNGEPIKRTKQLNLLENDTKLVIVFFSDAEADGGKYLCSANNRIGTVTKFMDIKIAGKPNYTTLWISLICVLIVIIIIVITYMGIRVHRERVLRKELLEAGLTHFVDGAVECLNPDLTLDDQAELLPYDKKWEFPRELLKLGKQLGSGAFGVVMKAEARGICVEGEVTTVAVKMVRRSADPSYMKALSSELKIMIHLGRHLNVVNLLGACTKTILTKRELYVIVEYCRYGNLHNYLQRHRSNFIDQIDPSTQKIDPNIGIERLVRSESIGSQNRLKYAALSFSRSVSIKSSDSNSGSELVDYRQGTDFGDINMSPDGGVLSNNSVQPGWRSNYRGDYKDQNLKPICTQDLLCWAWQVSRGMEYLSSRNVLHGDLAARNILLADDNIVKICDFGLAKNMYKDNNYKKKGDGPLPIKWMAVESIRDRMFSTQSDVWSFGIVLWEFFTLARTPYPGMEAEKQYDRLIEGYRMEKPEFATDEIYDTMLQCWKAKPSLRPLFPELAEKIGTMMKESIKSHYLELNTPYMDMNTMAMQNGQSDYLTMMSSPNHVYLNAPDPTLEVRPDSAYMSMSPLNKTSESGIFSPRSETGESHFNFPPPSKNTPIHSDSEDCIESAPMLTSEDPYMKPIDVQQRRAEFIRQSKEQIPNERDSGYCNVTTNPHFSKSNNQSANVVNSSADNSNANELLKNNNKLTPPIISGNDNYVNMPQQKTDRSKDAVVDSFSNPSYVIMSKLEEDRQFA